MQSEFQTGNKDIVSVAVEIANEKHLRKLNQNEPLSEIVQAMCTEFSLSKDSGMYALQLMEQDAGDNKYVTEENRGDIKNGSILRLVLSPSEIVRQIITRLDPDVSDVEGKQWALFKLSTLSADPVFAKVFLASNGYKLMLDIILDNSETPTHITFCLQSLIWFLYHSLSPLLEDMLIKRLVEFVNSERHYPMELIECCLVILEKAVRHKGHSSTAGIGIPDLIQHLWNRESPVVQEKALALINALARGLDSTKILGSMVSKQTRETIHKNILCSEVSKSMAHELYVFQTLILGLLKDRATSKIDPSRADLKYITEINNILAVADQDMRSMKGSIASLEEETRGVMLVDRDLPNFMTTKPFLNEDFVCSTPQPIKAMKKAAYARSKSTPLPDSDTSAIPKRHSLMIDFTSTSNSCIMVCRLTLDCILYFARRYRKTFVRVVLEEEALSRSFPCMCERLTQILCELLGVGKPPTDDGVLYQPMIFTAPNDHPFLEEVFCRAALLMGRTRREMRARTFDDQEKVEQVVQRQLKEALALKPATLEQLDEHLRRFPYSVIAEIWQTEHEEKVKWELTHLPPILQLREERTVAILELIQQQRISILLRGAKFPKYTARGQRVKKKSWFVYLSTNQKVFHYGDCDDADKPILDCSSKVAVSNIRMLVTGKKCPHVRELRNRKSDQEVIDLAFSILLDEEPHTLDFVAPDQRAFDYWTDGMNCLLGQPMTSATKESELKTLLNLELRLQLLDTEGIHIPSKPPPIPDDPPNYNFHYK
ncbi:engulfment and cell motility protein 1-like [Periplaneta americana]|uniref:engulfment and cell motility protein 1-like n=1 Tax=Periplaneta americana TaxID=6978 RepID=UPI0037E7137C